MKPMADGRWQMAEETSVFTAFSAIRHLPSAI
jgi:hypothetical protein